MKDSAAACRDTQRTGSAQSPGLADGEIATPGKCLAECTALQLLSAFMGAIACVPDWREWAVAQITYRPESDTDWDRLFWAASELCRLYTLEARMVKRVLIVEEQPSWVEE